MKLAEWEEEDRVSERIAQYVTGRLEELEATEDATLVLGAGLDGRTLVAADIGLFDCHYVMPLSDEEAPTFMARLLSWDGVPAPSVDFKVQFGGGAWGAFPGDVHVHLDIEPLWEELFSGRHRDGALAYRSCGDEASDPTVSGW